MKAAGSAIDAPQAGFLRMLSYLVRLWDLERLRGKQDKRPDLFHVG